MSGGMGLAPLPATEVEAWARGADVELTSWEFSLILRVSRNYIHGMRDERAPHMPTRVAEMLLSAKLMGQLVK